MKINPIKRGFSKPNVITFDVETTTNEDSKPLKLKLAVVECNGRFVTCKTRKDLTLQICNFLKKGRNVIFAHNAQFDYPFIEGQVMKEKGYDITTINTQPFFVSYRDDKKPNLTKKVLFLDSLNYFKMSLKALGEILGVLKGEINFDTCSTKELEEYCKQDVRVLKAIVDELFKIHTEFDVEFSITFPSLAYRVFRKHYLHYPLIIPQQREILELERRSYYGGRVEVFNFNKHPAVHVYDFNSLYPSVMFENNFPVECVEYWSPNNLKKYSQKHRLQYIQDAIRKDLGVIATVQLKIPKSVNIGIVPTKYNERLIFPVGTFETTIPSPEIELCSQYITMIKEFAVYKMDSIFEGYVTDIYEKRLIAKEQDDEVRDMQWKLFLTSLYGKFAQRKFIDVRLHELDGHFENNSCDMLYKGEPTRIKWINGNAFMKETEDINEKSFVAIASFVTSYARKRLYESLKANPKTIYCDTDSIFLDYHIESDDETLGALKLEYTYEDFEAIGNKAYLWNNRVNFKIKGTPRRTTAEKGQSMRAQIVLSNDCIKTTFRRITKMMESLNRWGDMRPRSVPVEKKYSLDYTKRIRTNDGLSKPIKMLRKYQRLLE